MDRRSSLKSSSLAILGLAAFTSRASGIPDIHNSVPEPFPNLPPEVISDVVGKSHFDLDAVRKLVGKRPELSRSVWEWRFGDFESAIGAASHVGRRDIAIYLMEPGARPTLFTFAMLGRYQVVKSIIDSSPGIQQTTGPHGISLPDHALAGQRMRDEMSDAENENLERTIEYLTGLGDAGGDVYIAMGEDEKKAYLGTYMYGPGEKEGFTIDLNMRKLLSLAPIGEFGGALYKTGENRFIYNGAPSVQISFEVYEEQIRSMTISDPDVTVIAEKVDRVGR